MCGLFGWTFGEILGRGSRSEHYCFDVTNSSTREKNVTCANFGLHTNQFEKNSLLLMWETRGELFGQSEAVFGARSCAGLKLIPMGSLRGA